MPLLAAKLLDLREEHGYSQQFVAEYLNMSREGYCNYERAAREPGLDVIMKLCILYQIKVSDLINPSTVFPSVKKAKAAPDEATSKTKELSKSYVEKNLTHMLKLLSGKNARFDFSSLTKEDISFLISYKLLNKEEQEEIREFLSFKQYYKKNKEKE
jgi:transcriptional regulator with XRE-family HTH domain